MPMKPSERFPVLKDEYVIRVADILRRSRDSAARHAKWKLGDCLTTIGLTAYYRSCRALAEASAHEYREWLQIEIKDNHFIIKMKGAPSRFYRGDLDLPVPPEKVAMGPEEKLDTALAFHGMEAPDNLKCLRFEVEKNHKGFTKGVYFVQVDQENQRIDSWPVPRFVAQEKAKTTRKGSVKLPPISLDPPASKDDEASA